MISKTKLFVQKLPKEGGAGKRREGRGEGCIPAFGTTTTVSLSVLYIHVCINNVYEICSYSSLRKIVTQKKIKKFSLLFARRQQPNLEPSAIQVVFIDYPIYADRCVQHLLSERLRLSA